MDTTITTHVDTPCGQVEVLIHDRDRISIHGSNPDGLLIHGVRYSMNLPVQRQGDSWVWDHINGVGNSGIYHAVKRADDSFLHASPAAQKTIERSVLPPVIDWIDQCPTLLERAHMRALREELGRAERALVAADAAAAATRRKRDDLLRALGLMP